MKSATIVLMLALAGLSLVSGESEYDATPDTFQIIRGIILVIAGGLFLFFGIHFFKTILFLTGFAFGWIFTEAFLLNQHMFTVDNSTLMEIIPVVVGLVVGYLFLSMVQLGVLAIGALGGFALAIVLLSYEGMGVLDNSVARPLLITLLPCIMAVLAIRFESQIIIGCTALFGAFLFCLGVDAFAATGFTASARYAFENKGQVAATYELQVLVLAYLVVAVLGAGVQMRIFARHSSKEQSSQVV